MRKEWFVVAKFSVLYFPQYYQQLVFLYVCTALRYMLLFTNKMCIYFVKVTYNVFFKSYQLSEFCLIFSMRFMTPWLFAVICCIDFVFLFFSSWNNVLIMIMLGNIIVINIDSTLNCSMKDIGNIHTTVDKKYCQ